MVIAYYIVAVVWYSAYALEQSKHSFYSTATLAQQEIKMQTCFYITQYYINDHMQQLYQALGKYTTQQAQTEAYHQILMEQVILCMKQLSNDQILEVPPSLHHPRPCKASKLSSSPSTSTSTSTRSSNSTHGS